MCCGKQTTPSEQKALIEKTAPKPTASISPKKTSKPSSGIDPEVKRQLILNAQKAYLERHQKG